MPLLLLMIGGLFVAVAINNTQKDLGKLVQSTFTGPNNFLFWVLAIGLIGSLGYIKPIKPLANAFLVLIVIVVLLADVKHNGASNGFFAKLQSAFTSAGIPVNNTDQPDKTLPAPASSGGSKGFDFGNIMGLFKDISGSGGSIFDGVDTTPLGSVDLFNTSFGDANNGSIFSGTDNTPLGTVDYGSSLNLSGFGN